MIRHLAFDRLCNFRDLGGYTAADGRTTRWGRVYRSDSLGKLHGEGRDLERFAALGIRTVIDLRYPGEVERFGRVPEQPGLEYHNLSIEHRPYSQADLGPETEAGPYLAERFLEVTEDGVEELAEVLRVIAKGVDAPLVFHCAAGKDRTGIVAALLLSLLDVPEETIVADFARTELATDRLVADWQLRHPGRTLTWPGYGRAPAATMELFLAGLAAEYGSARDYVRDRLGVDRPVVDAFRARLLEG